MQSSRSNRRKNIEDLELRLGPSYPPKGNMLARNYGRGYPNLITIEDDDDDDILMYSRSPTPSSRAMPLFPISSSWVPIITEEDLELRLGFRAHSGDARHSAERRGETSHAWRCVKTKYGVASSSSWRCPTEVEGVKLRCTICMDTMKEETSTLCGHVFCKSCIMSAIRVQNKCPSCRKELTMNNIHRIYLPGATS